MRCRVAFQKKYEAGKEMKAAGKNQSRYFQSREKWREWLEKNHKSSEGIWVIFYKKHTGRKTVSYDEAVEEALCFGWIDSILTHIDDVTLTPKRSPDVMLVNLDFD